MPKNKATAAPYVNNTVDKLIKLAELEAYKKANKTAVVCHDVRVMMVYNTSIEPGQSGKDTVGTLAQIAKWSQTRSGEFRELMISLLLLAEGKAADEPRRLEKTELDEDIWEIKAPGQRLRLFAFIDNKQIIIIAEHYQKHGKQKSQEERHLQDRAIRSAMARRDIYAAARQISQDLYVVEKGVGNEV